MFGLFKKKDTNTQDLTPQKEVNPFADIDDSIQIGIDAGYDQTKAALLVLDVLIKEYKHLMSLGLTLSADRTYEKIEYCRTKK